MLRDLQEVLGTLQYWIPALCYSSVNTRQMFNQNDYTLNELRSPIVPGTEPTYTAAEGPCSKELTV